MLLLLIRNIGNQRLLDEYLHHVVSPLIYQATAAASQGPNGAMHPEFEGVVHANSAANLKMNAERDEILLC